MKHVSTLKFRDLDSADNGIAILRVGQGMIAIGLGLEKNGDLDIALSKEDALRFVSALQLAIENA
jgi:hypothetical protein